MARRYPGVIVGIKVAHYNGPDWNPVDRAVEATFAPDPVPEGYARLTDLLGRLP